MSYVDTINRFRKTLTYNPGPSRSVGEFSRAAEDYVILIRVFYCIVTFVFYTQIYSLVRMGFNTPTDPLWPVKVFWPLIEGNGVLLATVLPVTALFCVLFPGVLVFRVITFLGLLVMEAYSNSFGSTNHGLHFMIYVAFGLLFLPNGTLRNESLCRKRSMQILYVMWGLQLLLLFCYSLSGVWKTLGFQLDLFKHDTLAITVLNRSIEDDGKFVIWQSLIASHPALFQLMHVIIVFVQFTSLLVFFSPHFYRVYGTLMILFHFGTSYLLNISFTYHVFVLGIFFIMTPMAPKHSNFVLVLHAIPIFGLLFQRLFPLVSEIKAGSKLGGGTIVYDGECPFCRNYVEYIKLRSMIGGLELVNARMTDHPLVDEIKRRQINLNEGMVFIYKGKFYYGSQAMNKITQISRVNGFLAHVNYIFFSNQMVARIFYPVLKLGRRLNLRLLGKRPIQY